MSQPIAADSARRPAAEAFAAELRRIMKVRKVGRRQLAKAMKMSSDSIIHHWRSGNGLPRADSAEALAQALDHPKLLAMVKAARIGTCQRENCGKTFVNEGGAPKRYCSPRCFKIAAKMRVGVPTRARAYIAERDAAEARLVVKKMCRSCEPEGMCHTPNCPLRSLSPLPLVVLQRDVDEAHEAPGPYGTPESRAKTVAATRAALAKRWADPAEHEKQSNLARQMHADGRMGGVRIRRPATIEPYAALLEAAIAVYREEINDRLGSPQKGDAEQWWVLWRAILAVQTIREAV
ncbi:MAG: hypothetical protein ACREQ5_25615 [Candidatus Dormibacteria bacterium]